MPHNLPAEPNRFIGRARDIDELRGLFDEDRIVTLAGVGGIGKTRLATRVAAESVPDFAGGVWLVELARINRPDLIAQEIAATLGVREDGGRPLMDSVVVRLRGARTLLVIDNCEHLIEACADVVGSLAASCPELRFLVTSREPLHIRGELLWRVPPLGAATEAVQLFVDRAQAAGSRLDPVGETMADVAELCRALDGLPLAIELAAARTTVLSPRQIIDRLGDRFRLLTTGDRDAPDRQRTLLATVEWSHSMLSERERVLLRRLSVFAGPFDLALAEEVCADRFLPEYEVLDLLGGLVDKSLVLSEGNPSRYRLLETIKEYAAERLRSEAEDRRLRDRHLLVLTERAVSDFEAGMAAPKATWQQRRAALHRSLGLLDDHRAALDWAIESGQAESGMRLCCHAGAFWVVNGTVGEAKRPMESLLALDPTGIDPLDLLLARGYYGQVLAEGDQVNDALEILPGVVEGLGAMPYNFAGGIAHSALVLALFRTGRFDEVSPHLTQQLAMSKENDDPLNEALALFGLSALAMMTGRLREAQRHAEQALEVTEASGHQWGVARALVQLGEVAAKRGDLAAAREHYEAAIPVLQEIDNRMDLARCLDRIGKAAAAQREFGVARTRLAESLELSRRNGQLSGIARALGGMAVLAEAEGNLEGAVLAAAAATAIRESIGQHFTAVKIDELLARARVTLGEGRTGSLWARGGRMSPEEVSRNVLQEEREERGPAVQGTSGSLLTAREQEIAGLLTKGLSNRAIADELVISPATVARHIANIMDKLGHTSRAQIAVWASDHGLGSA
ncbi:ATP-binding protein [Nonomuraea sp. NPDC050556]|uniref:ATP-binding protein n=1 Tax=Nonomuraea sp. NPDC050556 TaxID=3364369 RepID=UPI0037BCAC81